MISPHFERLEHQINERFHRDPSFSQRLRSDPRAAVSALGIDLPSYVEVEVGQEQVHLRPLKAPTLDPRPVYFEPNDYPCLGPFLERWEEIRVEAEEVIRQMQRLDVFYPMHFRKDNLLSGGSRGRFMLFFLGMRLELNQRRCPVATSLCWKVPGLVSAGFYILGPQTRMLAHTGVRSDILRAHLGLVVPPDCALKVAFEERSWEEGKFLIFDDTHLHEAWNLSDSYRCVFHLDFAASPSSGVEHASLVRSLRARYLSAGPGFHPWLVAAETVTDEDHAKLFRDCESCSSEAVAAARMLAAEHGVFL